MTDKIFKMCVEHYIPFSNSAFLWHLHITIYAPSNILHVLLITNLWVGTSGKNLNKNAH